MSYNKIAKRYAKALHELSEEQGSLKTVVEDMNALKNISNSSHDFLSFVESPIISSKEKEEVVLVIAEKSKFAELTIDFLRLLAKKKRMDIISSIIQEFNRIIDVKNNVVNAVLETVVDVDENQEKEIVLYLEKTFKKKIRLKKQINKSIGGGFKILVDDKMIDSSIAYQLKKLYSQLLST